MNGPEASEAYYKAKALLKEGKYLEAVCVPMMSSDLQLIVDKVRDALAASAKTANSQPSNDR